MQEIIENGVDRIVEEKLYEKPYEALPVLPQGALRRLWRMSVTLEGATAVAQAAMNIHQAQRAGYQQAFEAACEDASIQIPPGEHDVQIDWQTGDVKFTERQTQT